MSTFLADMIQKGYTDDEVFGVLFESERERKRREMLTRVTKTVDAHRLKQMKGIFALELGLRNDERTRKKRRTKPHEQTRGLECKSRCKNS